MTATLEIIDKRDSLSELVSPFTDRKRPVYNWHSFKHSYSKALVDVLAKEFGLERGAWVLDPFCGGGTTLLACKELGINAQGFDVLPFAVFLANVKTRSYDPNELFKVKKTFRPRNRISMHIPSLTNIDIARKAFSVNIRNELIKIKQWIREIDEPESRDFFNLGMLSILESVSRTSKAGGFLRLRKNRVRADAVTAAYLRTIDSMLSDVRQFNGKLKWKDTCASASPGDARKLNISACYDAVITSPPYPNRHDYTRIYLLEMLFDFVKDNEELKSIRYGTLRSHVEARRKYECRGYVVPALLSRSIGRVDKNGTNNPMVTRMLEGYFEDMFLALREMSLSLRNKGKVAVVVSNVRFAGVNIPVDEILAEVGLQAGLRPKAIWIARLRGNSPQQMREYRRKPSRESIVIWEK